MASASKKLKIEEVPSSSGHLQTQPSLTIRSPYQTSPQFLSELLHRKVESLIPPDGRIFVAQRTDKIVDVWKGLMNHNFLSVPVLQKSGMKYYGLVDIADIVLFVVRTFGSKLNVDSNFWEMDISQQQFFKSQEVKNIMTHPISRRNPFHPITKGYTLFCAVEILAKERGLHRVPVIDQNRQLVNMISQSQILNFIVEHLEILGSIKNKPSKEYLSPDVISVNEDDIALGVFQTMVEKNLSGVAVVNSQGKLVETLSIRDLKAIQNDGRMFWRLNQSVKHFLEKIKQDYLLRSNRPKTLITGTLDEPMESILKKLSEQQLHRIFIINQEYKPIGVISLKDILFQIISNPGI